MKALLLALALGAGQDSFEAGEVARQEGRFADALRHAEEVADAPARARLELNTRYWAGDLGGALRAGRRGLAAAPEDPWLLYYTARLALEVGALEPAAECVPRLARAAEAADLAPETVAFYAEQSALFEQDLEALQAADAARETGTRRARLTVLAGALVAVAAFVLLARAVPDDQPSGTAQDESS